MITIAAAVAVSAAATTVVLALLTLRYKRQTDAALEEIRRCTAAMSSQPKPPGPRTG